MKKSDPEFNRHILIAIGSIGEIAAILDICLDQKYINTSVHKDFMLKSEALAKRLFGLSKTLTKNKIKL